LIYQTSSLTFITAPSLGSAVMERSPGCKYRQSRRDTKDHPKEVERRKCEDFKPTFPECALASQTRQLTLRPGRFPGGRAGEDVYFQQHIVLCKTDKESERCKQQNKFFSQRSNAESNAQQNDYFMMKKGQMDTMPCGQI